MIECPHENQLGRAKCRRLKVPFLFTMRQFRFFIMVEITHAMHPSPAIQMTVRCTRPRDGAIRVDEEARPALGAARVLGVPVIW